VQGRFGTVYAIDKAKKTKQEEGRCSSPRPLAQATRPRTAAKSSMKGRKKMIRTAELRIMKEWDGGIVRVTGPHDDGWELSYTRKDGAGVGICGYPTKAAAIDDRNYLFCIRYGKKRGRKDDPS
jgi:hypothetical protein